MSDPGLNLSAALALGSSGVRIFPAGPDKRPLFKQWQENSAAERDVISEWWRRMPWALPAIPCGPNGLLVIDLDRHSSGCDGVNAFKDFVGRHSALPQGVPMVKTPNGGLHLYFQQPVGEPLGNGRGSLPAGCDVRGAGGFVMAPGAVLPDGRGWIQVATQPPITRPAQLGWIEKTLRRPPELRRESYSSENTSEERGRAYAERALHELEAELAVAREGERNHRLYQAAFRLGTMAARGWLMEAEITEVLLHACESNQYLREHGHRATVKTIESGLHDGIEVPHDDLEDRDQGDVRAPDGDLLVHSEQQSQPEEPQRKNINARRRLVTGDWDDPDQSILDDRRGELPELPLEAFPKAMHRWILEAAGGAGVTAGHIALPLVGIASGLIGVARRVQATRSWLQPMTCWTCLVGLSGSGKTPSLDVVRRALSVVERSRQEENSARQLAHETRVERAKAALKKWKEDIAAAVEAGQPPPVKPAEAQDVRPFVVPRLFVNDCTIERLAPLLEARPRGVIYVADELARLFQNLERYSGGSDRSFWLESWDGNSFVVERLGRPPVILRHLLVGVVGGFQPDLLARSFDGDSDGIYARFLYAWPPEAPFRQPSDDADETDPEIINAFGRLANLQAGDDDAFAPRSIPLTADGRKVFAAFAEFAHRERQSLEGRNREYWCKGTGHVLRLAGVLCFLEWAWTGGPEPQAIDARHVESAVLLWREYFWPHGRAALHLVGVSDKHNNGRAVLRWLRTNAKMMVSREEVRREALSRRLDAGETQTLLDTLERAGWLREVTAKASGPGRPARRWEVNPRLIEVHF